MLKRRYYLGIHTGHDRGATLIEDGKIVFHIPEDRLDRVKHSESQELPFLAISKILELTDCKLSDIVGIGLSCVNRQSDAYLDYYRSALEQKYDAPCPPMKLASHHLCHALCCLLLSNDKEVFSYVYDGAGDLNAQNKMESETLFRLTTTGSEVLHQRMQDYHESFNDKTQFYYSEMMYGDYADKQISLGKKYNQFTARCGFGAFEDGKTMGLAPYGKPLFDSAPYVPQSLDFKLSISDLLNEVATCRKKSGLSYFQFDRDRKADLAATMQEFLEQSMLSLTASIATEYGVRNISLCGGVALNCITNHKVNRSGLFENVRPFPAAGDDGQSIGAALFAMRTFDKRATIKGVLPIYSGPGYSTAAIEETLRANGLDFAHLTDPEIVDKIADAISDAKVVGLHRGRSEIGPRALGHRSILASATHPKMKDILNEKVKFRELFRPYAPMVLAQNANNYFQLEAKSPFMMFACGVHLDKQDLLPSITHIDGTARVQTVCEADDEFLNSLLIRVGEVTGHPVIINTSFNLAGEPIVETPDDAVRTFLRSGIDLLVVGNYVVSRSTH